MKPPSQKIFATFHLDASSDLEFINKVVKRYEETLGPLAAMGIEGDQTILRFAATEPAPDKVAVISPLEDEEPPEGDDEVLVTTGTILIDSEEKRCVAVRPS